MAPVNVTLEVTDCRPGTITLTRGTPPRSARVDGGFAPPDISFQATSPISSTAPRAPRVHFQRLGGLVASATSGGRVSASGTGGPGLRSNARSRPIQVT